MRRVPLSQVAAVNPSTPSDLVDTTPVSFLPMSAISEEGGLALQEVKRAGDVRSGYTYFERGDVIVAKITPCFENGKAAHLRDLTCKVGFGSTEFHVLRPGPEVDARYLFYLVWSPHFRHHGTSNMTGTAGQRRVPASFLRDYRIPLPLLPEQKRIAAILDTANEIRRKRQESLRLADQFLRSVFLDLFGDPAINPKGWPIVKLGEAFSEDPRIGTIRPAQDRGTVPVVRVGELGGLFVDLEKCKSLDLSRDDLKRYGLRTGDLLLARAIGSEELLGKTSILQDVNHPIAFDSHVMRLRLKPGILHPIVLRQLFETKGGRARFMRQAGRTAVQFNVNSEQISNIEIPLPPLERQQRFLDVFDRVIALTDRNERMTKLSDSLFSSLSQRAFRGEL